MLIITGSSRNSRGDTYDADVRYSNSDSISERTEALSEAPGRLVKAAARLHGSEVQALRNRDAGDAIEIGKRSGQRIGDNPVFLVNQIVSDRYLNL